MASERVGRHDIHAAALVGFPVTLRGNFDPQRDRKGGNAENRGRRRRSEIRVLLAHARDEWVAIAEAREARAAGWVYLALVFSFIA